ncbi:uracil permease [Moniliophthora roreri MCA 2997]|uniref:Uracil permease n=1 Tax=Moniliophthora roreri (strain MCA 2997) TaxID=1381753 RepID=V2YWS1_MONRO|nr:uracil permease [Moniliophthora roreri MCA 2997]
MNQADIARYARKPNDQFWGQILMFPITSAIPGLYGILIASASKELYGKALWNLWDVTQSMLDQYPNSPGARFGVFLAAGSMALALTAINLSTNVGSISLPIHVHDDQILKDGKTFLAFLSGYGYCMYYGFYKIWSLASPLKDVLEGQKFEAFADGLDEEGNQQLGREPTTRKGTNN